MYLVKGQYDKTQDIDLTAELVDEAGVDSVREAIAGCNNLSELHKLISDLNKKNLHLVGHRGRIYPSKTVAELILLEVPTYFPQTLTRSFGLRKKYLDLVAKEEGFK